MNPLDIIAYTFLVDSIVAIMALITVVRLLQKLGKQKPGADMGMPGMGMGMGMPKNPQDKNLKW